MLVQSPVNKESALNTGLRLRASSFDPPLLFVVFGVSSDGRISNVLHETPRHGGKDPFEPLEAGVYVHVRTHNVVCIRMYAIEIR